MKTRLTSCYRLVVCCASLAAFAPGAAADDGPELAFSYHGPRLIVTVPSAKKAKVTVSWRAVDKEGRPFGPTRRLKGEIGDDAKPLALKVGDRAGHRVRVRARRRNVTIWANRGVWYARPAGLSPHKVTRRQAKGLLDSDIALAGGVEVHTRSASANASERLIVGRTLGFDSGFGVRAPARAAIVLRARASVGVVRLTVTERIDAKTVHYYDYPLVLSAAMRRYVIPLDKLTPRPKASGRRNVPRTIHAISLTAHKSLKAGAKLEIEALALSKKLPRVLALRRGRRGVRVNVRGSARSGLKVGWVGPSGQNNEKAVRGATTIPANATRVWVCQADVGCDPADAPKSGYAPPAPRNGALVVDDFWGLAPVDPRRKPTLFFASSPAILDALQATRTGSSLQLSYNPKGVDDHIGYRVNLPRVLPRKLRSLKLTLRGSVDPSAIEIGLRDRAGKEPKISLSDYVSKLGSTYRSISIPLDAFRARALSFKNRARPHGRNLVAASVVLGVNRQARDPQIELAKLELSPQLAPLTLVSFDGPAHQTSLGGAITIESRFGGDVRTALIDGKMGKGLRIRAGSIGGKAYALVSFNIRRINAKPYHSLTFWVRGERGRENPTIVLRDARKKHRAPRSRSLSWCG
jgi:hypothetical protein